jgi:hypothetical protein
VPQRAVALAAVMAQTRTVHLAVVGTEAAGTGLGVVGIGVGTEAGTEAAIPELALWGVTVEAFRVARSSRLGVQVAVEGAVVLLPRQGDVPAGAPVVIEHFRILCLP